MSCPICASQLQKNGLQAPDFEGGTGTYQIVRCDGCGVRLTNPRPVEEDIPKLYEDRVHDALPDSRSLMGRLRRIRARWFADQAIARLELGRSLAVADVGTGDGFFARAVADAPWCSRMTAAGFFSEPPRCFSDAPPHCRYESYEAFFENEQAHDLVFLRYALEHVPNPREFLERIVRCMKPRGGLVVEVPNWRATWRRILGSYYSELSPPAHLFHFDPDSLRRLLPGFVVTIDETRAGMVLPRSLAHVFGRSSARVGAFALPLHGIELLVNAFAGPAPNMAAFAVSRDGALRRE